MKAQHAWFGMLWSAYFQLHPNKKFDVGLSQSHVWGVTDRRVVTQLLLVC